MTAQQLDIRAIRQQLGLNQRDLAERLGVSKRTISRWETGSSQPHLVYREQLAGLWRKQWQRKRLPLLEDRP